MNTLEIIAALRKQGHKVAYRKRTDGGYLITKLDRERFTGAKGNARGREILGVSLSKARREQTSYNVASYIRGKKKTRTLDQEIKYQLRKVQREWRKNKVKGKVTAHNVKRHIREFGMEEAMEYLKRQSRYGAGFAYEKNVEYLAQYVEDIAKSLDETTKAEAMTCAAIIRATTATFKDKWIEMIYSLWYEVRNNGFSSEIAREAIRRTYEIMKG